MDKLFNLKIIPRSRKHEQQVSQPQKDKNIPFTGSISEKIPKGIAKILDWPLFREFAQKHQNNDKNIAKHMTAVTDILLTSSFAFLTNKNDKIKEDRKKVLILGNIIPTAVTLSGGYTVDRIIKNHSQKFIDKFSTLNKNDSKLSKYIEGINIIRPAIIFAVIYYGFLPMVSTYMAEKIDKKFTKDKPDNI